MKFQLSIIEKNPWRKLEFFSIAFLAMFIWLSVPTQAVGKALPKCLYIASYHNEQPWTNTIGKSLRAVLKGKCEVKQFDLDTKRNPDPGFGRQKALEAKALIESWKPDIVIASDDNASKYLIKPYFKNAKLPFVFCGLNAPPQEYGYPYSNVTGMLEVEPIRTTIKQIKRILPDAETAACFRANDSSSEKICNRYKKIYKRFGINIKLVTVNSMDDFEKELLEAQKSDFIIVANVVYLADWDIDRVKEILLKQSEKLTVGFSKTATDHVMLSFALTAEEQGEYAALTALKILEGTRPDEIPIIPNYKWNLYINEPLLKKAGTKLPRDLMQKAIKVK